MHQIRQSTLKLKSKSVAHKAILTKSKLIVQMNFALIASWISSISIFLRWVLMSKSVPEIAVFRKFKGPNIKYSHRDPQKALPYPERRHLTYFT